MSAVAFFSKTNQGSAAEALWAVPDQLADTTRYLVMNLLSIPMVMLSLLE